MTKENVCPFCGSPHPENTKFCPNTGRNLAEPPRKINFADETKQADKGKKGRWGPLFQWTDILSTVISLIATILVGLSINLFSDKVTPAIPTSFVVAFSIAIGVAIILYVAWYFYRKRIADKKVAISEMYKSEQTFFSKVDAEISALLSEKVN